MELENNLLLVSAIAVTLKQMSEGTPLTVVVLGLPRATAPSSTTHLPPAPPPAQPPPQPCCSLPALLAHSVFKAHLPALKGRDFRSVSKLSSMRRFRDPGRPQICPQNSQLKLVTQSPNPGPDPSLSSSCLGAGGPRRVEKQQSPAQGVCRDWTMGPSETIPDSSVHPSLVPSLLESETWKKQSQQRLCPALWTVTRLSRRKQHDRRSNKGADSSKAEPP